MAALRLVRVRAMPAATAEQAVVGGIDHRVDACSVMSPCTRWIRIGQSAEISVAGRSTAPPVPSMPSPVPSPVLSWMLT
jgi:hypothetical protein